MNIGSHSKMPEDPFTSELSWPFILRKDELRDCLDCLSEDGPIGPTLIKFSGKSGCGKSFFVRELIARHAQNYVHHVTIYIDVYSADLEASRFFLSFVNFLGKPRIADRALPVQIPPAIWKYWRMRNSLPQDWRASYAYRVARDLVGQIPFAGPFLKALMPASISLDGLLDQSPEAAFRYLIKASKGTPVVLAIDNVQFLSDAMRAQIDSELQDAGANLRLLLIERIDDSRPVDWAPAIAFNQVKLVHLESVTRSEVHKIVGRIIGETEISSVLSDAIYRRSGGNLKSIWFQLKLAAQRQSIKRSEDLPDTYEEVISSLSPSDQAVLRLVVFLLGGLTVAQLGLLFQASTLGMEHTTVTAAVSDLTALGLLVVDSESNDRVKIEHEIVSRVVSEITPEEEKLELRRELVLAINKVLNESSVTSQDASLYDRLLGITEQLDVKQSPSIQGHIVRFLGQQDDEENYTYLSTLLRDSVCWEILDILPSHTVRILLNSVQKCSQFSFGLVAAEKLKASPSNKELAYLYEAKFLVQLFRYVDASKALENVPISAERRLVQHNMLLGQSLESEARAVTEEVLRGAIDNQFSEFDAVLLRNSAHLFRHTEAKEVILASVEAFRKMGSRFGTATALNNLGVAQISAGDRRSAYKSLSESLRIFRALGSSEAYQPHVNFSALALDKGYKEEARKQLRMARDLLPKGLLMDDLMIAANFIIIDLVNLNELKNPSFQQLKDIHAQARKTSDARFIDTLGHFVANLEAIFESTTTTVFSEVILERVLDADQSGMELYFDVNYLDTTIKAPYFLSPHWRY